MSETEQNKTEEATPFKLRKAREKGQVAKGPDLGYFSTLTALCLFSLSAGGQFVNELLDIMRRIYATSIRDAGDPSLILSTIGTSYAPLLKSVALLGATIMIVVIFFEIIQVRGLYFTPHPLKPDFNRLNPAKGLKRLFSMKMLKDTLKSIFKMLVYTLCAYFVIFGSVAALAPATGDAAHLIDSMHKAGLRLAMAFALLALVFTLLDQVISRQEFRKQMRMSRSEVNREHKDREGDPRIKQKRKNLHSEFVKQTQGVGNLPGSDMLIVNPQHFAVALRYDPATMTAPTITAKGRNRFALLLKQEAFRRSIPVLEDPPLARSLFRSADPGQTISTSHFHEVAAKYKILHLRKAKPHPDQTS